MDFDAPASTMHYARHPLDLPSSVGQERSSADLLSRSACRMQFGTVARRGSSTSMPHSDELLRHIIFVALLGSRAGRKSNPQTFLRVNGIQRSNHCKTIIKRFNNNCSFSITLVFFASWSKCSVLLVAKQSPEELYYPRRGGGVFISVCPCFCLFFRMISRKRM